MAAVSFAVAMAMSLAMAMVAAPVIAAFPTPLLMPFMGVSAVAAALIRVWPRAMVGVVGNHIVARVLAVADNGLAAAASVLAIAASVGVVVTIGVGLVDDYFISPVEVIAPQPGRPGRSPDPLAIGQVDILAFWYIIVGLHVRQIIIFYVIVTGRAPQGLVDDVDVDLGLEGKT
jgi:hypothetical protein